MGSSDIKEFFQNHYNTQTGNNLQFECRNDDNKKLSQIVSPLMNEEDASNVCKELQSMLHTTANIKIYNSRQDPNKFRAVFMNPIEVFEIYVKQMIELLNQYYPFPNKQYHWAFPLAHPHIIAYKTDVSFSYSVEGSVDGNEKRAAITQYNEKLKNIFPEWKIITETHKSGDAFILKSFSFANMQAMRKVPSLRTLGIRFFEAHPDLLTKDALDMLPLDLRQEMKGINTNHNENQEESTHKGNKPDLLTQDKMIL